MLRHNDFVFVERLIPRFALGELFDDLHSHIPPRVNQNAANPLPSG